MYSEDRDDHDDELAMMASELITLTEKLEAGYVSRVGMESLPEFLRHLPDVLHRRSFALSVAIYPESPS